ncbi:MAG: sugar ABC transporter substrate-binding protein [Anaerolineae bacterium]|nr:sugar ABC transporter substrate-binding protein [Anaerolineae bacterium]
MLTGKRGVVSLFLSLIVLTAGGLHSQESVFFSPIQCTEPGKLTMWLWDEHWAEIIGDSIVVWTEQYCPGAEVEIVVQPWEVYWDLLKTNATSGTMPDVFNVSQDRFYYYAANGAVLDLQPYLDAAAIDTSQWGSGMIDPYRWGENGDLYATPVNWDTIAIYYNKSLFDAAKIPYPNANWTWDGFAAAAAALTEPDLGQYGAAVYSEYQSGYPNWIASTGIPPIVGAGRTQCTLSVKTSMDALNFLKGLYDRGYMPSISTIGGPSADDAFNFWLAGKVGMVSAGSWKLPMAIDQARFEWDVVQLPKNPTTERSRSIIHSVGYVASSRSENPDLAANLILFLSSDEGQQFFADAGGVAPANPSLQDQWVRSFGTRSINVQAFADATIDSQGVTVFEEIWDKINTEFTTNVFDRNMSVEEAAAEVCAFVNEQLGND